MNSRIFSINLKGVTHGPSDISNPTADESIASYATQKETSNTYVYCLIVLDRRTENRIVVDHVHKQTCRTLNRSREHFFAFLVVTHVKALCDKQLP